MSRFEPNDASADFPLSEGPSRSLVIASTPRSGTTMLSSGLWKTQLAGAPMEYVNPEDRAGFTARWGPLSDADYVARLHAHRTSPNGVFSAKLHFDQLDRTFRGADTLLRQAFPEPRYVFLRREDKLRQAVSFYRAVYSSRWVSAYGKEAGDVPFSLDAVLKFVTQIMCAQRQLNLPIVLHHTRILPVVGVVDRTLASLWLGGSEDQSTCLRRPPGLDPPLESSQLA